MSHILCGRNILRQLIKSRSVKSSGSATNPQVFAGHGLRYRKLEVVLTKNHETLGKAGETVKVAPGFFRNHLMPKKLAVPNVDSYKYLVQDYIKLHPEEEEEVVEVVPKTEEDLMKEYETAANRLENARLVLRRQIMSPSAKDELRVPVTKDELVQEIARQICVTLKPENLYLPSPLSTYGEFEVKLLFPKSIPLPENITSWGLTVYIRRK